MKINEFAGSITALIIFISLLSYNFNFFNRTTFEENYNSIVDTESFIDFDNSGTFDIDEDLFDEEKTKDTTCQFLDLMFPPLFIACLPPENEKENPLTHQSKGHLFHSLLIRPPDIKPAPIALN